MKLRSKSGGGGVGGIMEAGMRRVDLTQMHCMHVWLYNQLNSLTVFPISVVLWRGRKGFISLIVPYSSLSKALKVPDITGTLL